ncbi:DNA topoisomerase 4 subunit B [Candidatus Hepatoplasma crinochetorum Av]|uniref:DNA topoisomerase (ATP-hydrolyzing) n=1 Tax=Candidatus Hepatoplasma crinochetorum Av TaxID=1427984 RepID=W8GNF0_9MOLU|nr:DNA gyrase subunit B [Candidatus Hepatoplasma crinochetorum]AHK22551.1 DNA topoisomerase 4 subunit B [Candidatus Hepatoplasma crinochetorum Av]
MEKIKDYNANSIEVIENLDAVRKRPGMYIGDTRSKGLHQLFREIIDNSVDEHLAGFATKIKITLTKNNSLIIRDDGRGIPIDIHPKTKKPTIETIFTVLHAGGKFGGKNSGYFISGGLHGVGASVVNALSEYLIVKTWKDHKEYQIEFKNGGRKVSELKILGNTNQTGTEIEFKADKNIFSTINFSSHEILERIKEISYLNPKLKIEYYDLKNENKYLFHYPDGLKSFLEQLTKNESKITNIINFNLRDETKILVRISFCYTKSIYENIFSYVNNIRTLDGGSHETGFKVALTKAINEYAVEQKLQQNGKSLDGQDVREGIYCAISIYLIESLVQFEGQTKTKLSSQFARNFFEKKVYQEIKDYLYRNKKEAIEIIKFAYATKKARDAAKRARQATRELNVKAKKSFAGKLVPAQSKNPLEKELFIVEGDSAGGSAKMGRNRKIQAILPLKGKIINTEKASLRAIIENEELSTIINAIGAGFSGNFEIKKANYGKIIIMTDADTDGAHIQALLLTFFYNFMQEMINQKRIYIALPPLFKITDKKNKTFTYAWSINELKERTNNQTNYEIQRYKGLGEMNYEQLWETTMNPKTRTLIQVKNTESAQKIIEILMGQDIEARRRWIEDNVEFGLEDSFLNEK